MFIESHAIPRFGGPDGLIDHMLDHLLGTEVSGESLGTPNGTLTNFTGTLVGSPVPKSRFTISYRVGAVNYTATDDASGFITGTHINGAISTFVYATGVFNITFTTAPYSGSTLTASYIHGQPGSDWRLIRHTYSHLNALTDIRPNATSTTQSTFVLGTGNGSQTVFTGNPTATGYAGGVFPMFSPTLTFTIGGVAKTAHSHAIADLTHGNLAATDNRLIGNLTRHQTSGAFNHPDISTSSISWTSTRAISVTFATPPTNGTPVTVNYFIAADEANSCLECIIGSTGKNGLNPIYVGFKQRGIPTYTAPNTVLSVYAWNAWNSSPANTTGISTGIGLSRQLYDVNMSAWSSTLSMNLYANQGRIIGFIETQSSYYQSFYVGHFLRYTNPTNYANPVFVGSNNLYNAVAVHTSTSNHSIFSDVDALSSTGRHIMSPANSWFHNLTSGHLRSCSSSDSCFTPLGRITNGGVLVIPIYLWWPAAGAQNEFLGAFDDFYYAPCNQIATYDIIDDGVSTYRVFNDVGKVAQYNFYAVKRI